MIDPTKILNHKRRLYKEYKEWSRSIDRQSTHNSIPANKSLSQKQLRPINSAKDGRMTTTKFDKMKHSTTAIVDKRKYL